MVHDCVVLTDVKDVLFSCILIPCNKGVIADVFYVFVFDSWLN